ncbi:MAG: DUF948 domain-containing protein [Armatimonadota bacterium]|nr:DUF948 domain-containing protein [Armatimonadota bacterium]
MSESASLTLIAISQLVATIAVVILCVGMLYSMVLFRRMLSNKTDQLLAQIKPISERAQAIAEQAKQTADKALEKVDSMMSAAEDAVVSASDTARSVSRKIDESFTPRMAKIAALAVSIAKCVRVWQHESHKQVSDDNPSSADQ